MLFFLFLSIVFGYTTYVLYNKYLASQTSIAVLQNDVSKVNSELYKGNEQLNDMEAEKTSLKINRIVSNMTIADQEKKLEELQYIVQSQKNVLSNLKNSIEDALRGYNSELLSVSIIGSSVYVSLSEKLLFNSGSDTIDSKGSEALKSLAKVLNTRKDVQVMIEGHTDNIPIQTSKFKDNWDLSTARATSIVRLLTSDYGFDPHRIIASGRGQFSPLNSNETSEGRARNRRTEIILSPN